MVRSLAWISFVILALLNLSCDETPTTPTQPTPSVITETFSGTLGPQGRNTHTFTVQNVGGLDVIVLSISPDLTVRFGLGIGSPSGSDCRLQIVNNSVGQSSLLSASVTVAGTYCVAVFDTGGIAEGTTMEYSIQVSHF